MNESTRIAITSFVLALFLCRESAAQRLGAPHDDTVAFQPSMVELTRINAGRSVFQGYVLPCDFNQLSTPRPFGRLIEDIRVFRQADSTMLLQVTRSPLLAGGYALDSAWYNADLRPRSIRGHYGTASVEMGFTPDTLMWRVADAAGRTDSGRTRIPPIIYAAASDMLLARALRNPAGFDHRILKVTFVDIPTPQSEAIFSAYVGVTRTDSMPFKALRTRRAWAVAIGSGFDKVFFISRASGQLLGWEIAEIEGACPLRFVRLSTSTN